MKTKYPPIRTYFILFYRQLAIKSWFKHLQAMVIQILMNFLVLTTIFDISCRFSFLVLKFKSEPIECDLLQYSCWMETVERMEGITKIMVPVYKLWGINIYKLKKNWFLLRTLNSIINHQSLKIILKILDFCYVVCLQSNNQKPFNIYLLTINKWNDYNLMILDTSDF